MARQGNTNIINERGLYSIVMTSRKPEAREFKRWITQEIIPRKLFSKNI
ncbi:BRO-N domain-containing protein [Cytobacillus kochii]|nr:Bro-N domain-containing protein [Cytobacillus kochii]